VCLGSYLSNIRKFEARSCDRFRGARTFAAIAFGKHRALTSTAKKHRPLDIDREKGPLLRFALPEALPPK